MVTISDAFPSRFLKANDLPDGPVVATVKLAELEKIKGFDGKEQAKLVLCFAKKLKPLPLNRTNFELMTDIANSGESDDWPGTKVEVYVTKVTMPNGKPTDGVRLRKPNRAEKPKAAAPDADAKPDFNDQIPFGPEDDE